MTTTPHAVDSHAHVFCGDAYPFSPDTLYKPHPSRAGTAAKFRAVLGAHGLWPAVYVPAALAAGCEGSAKSIMEYAGAVVRFQIDCA